MTIQHFAEVLKDHGKLKKLLDQKFELIQENKILSLLLYKTSTEAQGAGTVVIPADLAFSQPEKVLAILHSKLTLNKKVFARNCEVKKISKVEAEKFLESYHLMGKTSSASNYGLLHADKLLAVASFSKGRKMNRLSTDQRSYELIRFCCLPGITVTGGLTKLLNYFCAEKKAGDVMTYIDKHLSDGSSFVRAGFKKHGETEPNFFLVNKLTHARKAAKKEDEVDGEKFYLAQNAGSSKLVYTPQAKK